MIELIQSSFGLKIFCVIAPFILLYVALKKTIFSYWQKHGVPYDDFTIPTGIFGLDFFTFKISISDVLKKSYNKHKKHPFHGIYMLHNKTLMVNDLDLIKSILTRDFSSFCDRGFYSKHEFDPLTGNLAYLNGSKWKSIRAKMSPCLTSGKLKNAFPGIREITAELIRVMDNDLMKTNIIEMKDILARYTTDIIFNLAFGANSRCLREPQNEFRYYGNLFFTEGIIRVALSFFTPEILDLLQIHVCDTRMTEFFIKLFEDMTNKRRKESTRRGDILDSLIDLMDNEHIIERDSNNSDITAGGDNLARRLELIEVVPQAFVFFLAGFETTSSLVSHWLYEFALNPDIQAKAHEEIDELIENPDSFTYENLMQLEYLDMTFQETLRKHTPLAYLNRICRKDYPIPNSDFVIEKGTRVVISVSGIHRNPDFYPEPEKFDPTRFTKENVATRHHFSYIPFGEGPRYCIGRNMGIFISKLNMFSMLANYKFSVCEKTPIPCYYSPNAFTQTPRDGIYLKVERRRDVFL